MLSHNSSLRVIAGVVLFALFHFMGDNLALAMVALVSALKEAHDLRNGDTDAELGDFLYVVLGGILGYFSGVH